MGSKVRLFSDQMNGASQFAGVASTTAAEASERAANGFPGLEIFGSGGQQISQQLGMAADSISNTGGIIERQTSAMFDMDAALAKAADQIEVPTDFIKNDANRFTTYHNEILEKLDGKSVNEGEGTRDSKELDGSGIDDEEKMKKLDTTNGAEQQEYDDGSGIGKEEEMANIKKAGGEENEEYDARSGVDDQENLRKLDTENGLEQQEYDPNSLINGEKALGNINTAGGTEQQELEGNSSINGQEIIGQLDGTENGLTREEIVERSRINAKEAVDKMSEVGEKLSEGANSKRGMQEGSVMDMLKSDFTENTAAAPVEKRIDAANLASAIVVPQMETVADENK